MVRLGKSAGYQYPWREVGWWILSFLSTAGALAVGLFTNALPLIAAMTLVTALTPLVIGAVVFAFLYERASQRLDTIDRSEQPSRWWAMQIARGSCLLAPLLLFALMATVPLAWPILLAAVVTPLVILVVQDQCIHHAAPSLSENTNAGTDSSGNPRANDGGGTRPVPVRGLTGSPRGNDEKDTDGTYGSLFQGGRPSPRGAGRKRPTDGLK